jgi:antitoxin component of RelBE/YafQ-DinJ toxin-antitoxin module
VDNKAMEKQSTLSTSIDSDLKKALTAFCKRRGLKIQSVVENAIREQLEDEIDLASYDERKNEEEISLAAVLKKLKK